jgi:hypothetical protein
MQADLLLEPGRSEAKILLKDYVELSEYMEADMRSPSH